jgi:hypothetical protein
MAKAAAGKAPWSEGYEGNPYRRFTAWQQHKAGLVNKGKGWISKADWDSMPVKPKMTTHILSNGMKVKTIDGDYDNYIGFQRPSDSKAPAMLQEISDAFNLADSERGASKKPLGVQHIEGKGHINWLEYNPNRQIMMVEFATDQAVVVYFQVPKNVWQILRHHAEAGGMRYDGKKEHYLLGIEFWNYIRIRGQITGSRYRYVYTQSGMSITGAESTDGGPKVSVQKEQERKEKEQPQSMTGKANRNTLEAYLRAQGMRADKIGKMSMEELQAQVDKIRNEELE